ncbi:Sec-independent protein translocase subunit TatA/TatB [Acidiluteibacter ferrifornacis]|uniref:Sec-independent protein translocase protein TatA n=1 Tax=Acidiluteibacter ferrifornacis TaxID=2692424 RepID=A0A6N9NQA3_9FLAO|nr:twin-arginine translocase TatA/TatE family subunit [Acidiluteibacter ferrifornacis]MBR9832633.1 twin-arginine translocase TatA/TatE family subunit [bacterium]NBG66585.1 twin-arginine translocase TatA/TatE family subunit [Acidiluteibacter ferrifornacis]
MLNSILLFFNIGTPELFVIILVIIMFFGSKKIPELARGLGKGIREFKNATSDIQEEIRKSSKVVNDEINITKDINSQPRKNNSSN